MAGIYGNTGGVFNGVSRAARGIPSSSASAPPGGVPNGISQALQNQVYQDLVNPINTMDLDIESKRAISNLGSRQHQIEQDALSRLASQGIWQPALANSMLSSLRSTAAGEAGNVEAQTAVARAQLLRQQRQQNFVNALTLGQTLYGWGQPKKAKWWQGALNGLLGGIGAGIGAGL